MVHPPINSLSLVKRINPSPINLQACFSLKEVTILDSIPEGFKTKGKEYNIEGKKSHYRVNFINTDTPKGNVTTHPRCIKVLKDIADLEEHPGFELEF